MGSTFRVLLAFGFLVSQMNADAANREMSAAASALLGALTPEQRRQTQLEFKDQERVHWHYVPGARKGLAFKQMSAEQRRLARALLSSGLSRTGYEKATEIISLETILAELEGGGGPTRDPELYYVTVFGNPGGSEPWGWRVEGHHLSVNVTSVGPASAAQTPSFFGSNPAEVRTGPRAGLRILASEEDLGRALVKSLREGQRKIAVSSTRAPPEILNLPGRADTRPEGIAYAQLDESQRGLLVRLIKEYLGRHRPDLAAADWERLERSGLERLHFTWAGGTERGQGHYYRVQGGTFVLEYDNTQNGANHVHSVWRDFDHDFGADLLKEHYLESHGGGRTK
ncbi:MAG TPA: DUF3500 domain-containing protein [Myxococcaceae bacterium]|nr:DUF3500 domain-containing protein [Myxococcaceae bacterium]